MVLVLSWCAIARHNPHCGDSGTSPVFPTFPVPGLVVRVCILILFRCSLAPWHRFMPEFRGPPTPTSGHYWTEYAAPCRRPFSLCRGTLGPVQRTMHSMPWVGFSTLEHSIHRPGSCSLMQIFLPSIRLCCRGEVVMIPDGPLLSLLFLR